MPKENSSIKFNFGNEQFVKDAGSLSLFTALGTRDDVDDCIAYDANRGEDRNILKNNKVSGICRIDYEMIPGISVDGTSDVNIASKKLYSYVRHTNSGHANYDSPDLMMYVYSVISIYSFIAACERVYGIIKEYRCKNRYYGKAIVESMGFDYDSIVKDLAGFRAFLNIAISKLNVLKVPSYWTIWTKNWYFNLLLFKDGDVDKSQIYYYRMSHAWKFNVGGTYNGSLTPVDLYAQTLNLDRVQALLNELINAIVAEEDCNIMSGDILKAYGEDKCINMPLLADEFEVTPVYDRAVLEMIHNTNALPMNFTFTATSGFIIRQDQQTNAILFTPSLSTFAIVTTGDNKACFKAEEDYLNFFRDDVTPFDVVSASSMTVLPIVDTNTKTVSLTTAGTEIATKINYISLPLAGETLRYDVMHRFEAVDVNGAGGSDLLGALTEVKAQVDKISNVTKFDWAPKSTMLLGSGSIGQELDMLWSVIQVYDLYNFTVVKNVDLIKLHNLHVLSAFGLAD